MRFFGAIFGLFFAGAGGFIAFETAVPTYVKWIEMKAWNATQAKIIEAGGEDNGVTATYQYEVAGNEHRGARVHIAHFRDNIGPYHIDMRHYLADKKRTGQPVTIWFDPDNPADSVIDRDMRWGLFALMSVFCSVFIIIGLVVAIASLKGKVTNHASPRFRLAIATTEPIMMNTEQNTLISANRPQRISRSITESAGLSGSNQNVTGWPVRFLTARCRRMSMW